MSELGMLISFEDQSKSFTYGVEYGRLLERMENGMDIICNNGLPVRIENKETIERTCRSLGYIPWFGQQWKGGWIEFTAIKKQSNDN